MEATPLSILLFACSLLCLGSFATLFTLRWPILHHYLVEQEAHISFDLPFNQSPPDSIIFGRSHCDHCQHKLSWQDTIPLISVIFLKGRCRYCTVPIASVHWKIEALFLITGLPLLFVVDNMYQLILTTIIIAALLTAAIIDYQHQLIPNECSGIAIAAALIMNLGSHKLDASVLGIVFGYVIIALLRTCHLHFRKIEGIGLGDAKLLAALGAWLYVDNLFITLLYASLLGILYTTINRNHKGQKISFGPFLTFSGIAYFYYIQL